MSRSWYEEQSKWNKSLQIFLFFFLCWHFKNIKQKQRLKSQSYYALVAVRGRLLHADQGRELLTTSNVSAVCLLSADCRHPERKSTWHALANARTKWLLRKTNPRWYIMTNPCTQVPAIFMYAWMHTPTSKHLRAHPHLIPRWRGIPN